MVDLPVLELRNNRRLGWLTLGVAAPALALGLVAGRALALFAGAAALAVGLWNLVDRRIKLRVDEVGILYARWGHAPVQWSEIAAFETKRLRGVEQVAIVPHDPDLLLQRMSGPQRWASRLAALGWSTRFVLSTAGLERGTADLVALLRAYHAAGTAPERR